MTQGNDNTEKPVRKALYSILAVLIMGGVFGVGERIAASIMGKIWPAKITIECMQRDAAPDAGGDEDDTTPPSLERKI